MREKNTLSDNKIPCACACGCGIEVSQYDSRGRQRAFKKGHRKKTDFRNFHDCELRYKGKYVYFPYEIRCGVCNWCRAVKEIDTPYTERHHDERRYDDSKPLRFTLEICKSCHTKEKHRLGEIDKDVSRVSMKKAGMVWQNTRLERMKENIRKMMSMLDCGLSMKQIAKDLSVDLSTVYNYQRLTKTDARIEKG